MVKILVHLKQIILIRAYYTHITLNSVGFRYALSEMQLIIILYIKTIQLVNLQGGLKLVIKQVAHDQSMHNFNNLTNVNKNYRPVLNHEQCSFK